MEIGIAQTVMRLLLSATAAESELTENRTAPTAALGWTEAVAMSEYVSREDAVKAIRERCSPCGEAIEAIRDAPTVDAVVVTRCKDCKHLRVWNQKDLYAFCPKTNFVFLPFEADTRTHFCSYGEPKETPHVDDHD